MARKRRGLARVTVSLALYRSRLEYIAMLDRPLSLPQSPRTDIVNDLEDVIHWT